MVERSVTIACYTAVELVVKVRCCEACRHALVCSALCGDAGVSHMCMQNLAVALLGLRFASAHPLKDLLLPLYMHTLHSSTAKCMLISGLLPPHKFSCNTVEVMLFLALGQVCFRLLIGLPALEKPESKPVQGDQSRSHG